MSFEDPSQLARCIKGDCNRVKVGASPFCAEHLREQETKSAGIVEPDVEERARAAGDAAMRLIIGQDPDTQDPLRLDVPSWDERAGISPELRTQIPERPDPTELEPHWDGSQWVLRAKERGVDLKAVRSLVRDLMHELGIREEGGDDHG